MNSQEFLNGINEVTEEQNQTHRYVVYDAVAANVFLHSKRLFSGKKKQRHFCRTAILDVHNMCDFVRCATTILK